MKSCFFIGHRETSSEILPALAEAVEQHITEYGVTEFIVGNYGGFDHMAAKAVIAAKERHPGITLLNLINDASSLEECLQANEESSRANVRISALRSELMSIDYKVSLALDKSVAVDVDKGFKKETILLFTFRSSITIP